MPEKDQVFSSKIKHSGIFNFKGFYEFCYDWLSEETNLDVAESKYSEKLLGDIKEMDIVWEGTRKITDYFKFAIKVKIKVRQLANVEIVQNGKKIKTNKGNVEVKVTGTLIKDYKGKFEQSAYKKFLRSVYEKWIIPARVDQFEEKLINDSSEFLNQAKAYLDLEGKR